jgi:hypothetical protein
MNNSHMSKIGSVHELVEAFGGTTAVARWLGVTKSCVSNWRADGAVPRGYHLQIFLEAKRRSLTIQPAVFNMPAEYFDTHPAE